MFSVNLVVDNCNQIKTIANNFLMFHRIITVFNRHNSFVIVFKDKVSDFLE